MMVINERKSTEESAKRGYNTKTSFYLDEEVWFSMKGDS